MYVTLTVVAGEATGKQLMLRSGQLASVGSTDWSDFRIGGDPALADRHFELACEPAGCRCRVLDPGNRLLRNEQPVRECWLETDDRLQAGETVFRVEISGLTVTEQQAAAARLAQAAEASGPASSGAAADVAEKKTPERTAAEIAEKAELSERAQTQLDEVTQPGPFFEWLVGQALHEDAIKFLAIALPPETAIRWAHDCLEELGPEMPGAQGEAFSAVGQWLGKPAEEIRERAAKLAKQAEYAGPASWLAAAVGWCGGDVAGAGAGPTPPPRELAGQAVAAALMLAATEQGDDPAPGRYEAFLECGGPMLPEASAG